MTDYVKGSKPRDLDAACGGLVLDRLRSFAKDPDDYHPMGSGLAGPENVQAYSKSDDGDEVRKGDTKSRSMSAIKKKSASAL